MPKVSLNDIASLANETSVISTINANNAAIEEGFNNTVSRDGTSPNTFETDIDMNSNRITNVQTVPLNNTDVATKYYVDYLAGTIIAATPTNPNDVIISGDLTVSGTIIGTISGYLQNIVEDTTPQLGGNLDLNGNVITGLEIGTDIQAYDAQLDDISALAVTDGNFIVGNGTNWVAESGATARTSLGVDPAGTDNSTDVTLVGTPDYITISGQEITRNAIDLTTDVSGDLPITEGGTGASDASTARTNLGLAIGTNVQAYDADLDTWATLTPSANAQSLVTAANYAAMRALLDLEAGTDFYSITAADTAIEVSSINAQTGTSYTLALSDRGQTVTMSNASANTLTIPTNASVAFDTGSVVHVIMLGAGTTTITGDTGVTVNGVSAGSGDINNQYQGVSLLKIGTNTWVASGDIGTVA